MPRSMYVPVFITIVRENLANRGGFLLICAQFVLHSAYSYLIRNWFLNFCAACSNVILLIVMNSYAIQPIPPNIRKDIVSESGLTH